jgi:hypothetical protein
MVIRSLLALSAFLTAALAAAEPGSVVRGAVKDDSGLVLPGVTVELDSVEASLSRSASTDTKGSYEIAGLPAGRYRLSFRLPSFATSVKSVSLEAGAEGQVDAVLHVALTADVLVTSRRTFRNLADIDEPVNGLIGLAGAGSEGVVAARLIEERPVYRAGEIFEAVPGVVISQHSGEGKANQYYVRGFNIDHGTDLATSR